MTPPQGLLYRRGVKTRAQLQQGFAESARPPKAHGTVHLVVARLGAGEHAVLDRGRITREEGLVGDRWAMGSTPDPQAQITVMERRVAALVADDQPLDRPGDNLVVDLDLDTETAPPGTRLRVGTCLLEVSEKPHTGCKKFAERFGVDACAWVAAPEHASLRLRGINCRVLEGGDVAPGDAIVNLGPPS